jgi:hypothetical protein
MSYVCLYYSSCAMERSMKQKFPSLDVVFTLIKERIDSQLAQVDAMDTKVNFILGSATAVISAGLVVQGLSPSSHCSLLTNKFLQSLPAISLFASYLATTLPAFFAYRLHAFKGVALPETLFDEYLPKEENTTKAEVQLSL